MRVRIVEVDARGKKTVVGRCARPAAPQGGHCVRYGLQDYVILAVVWLLNDEGDEVELEVEKRKKGVTPA